MTRLALLLVLLVVPVTAQDVTLTREAWAKTQIAKVHLAQEWYNARTEALAKLPEYQEWERARQRLAAITSEVTADATKHGLTLDLKTGAVTALKED